MFHNISNPKWFGNWSRLEDDYLGNGGTDIADNFTFSKREKTGGLFGSIISLATAFPACDPETGHVTFQAPVATTSTAQTSRSRTIRFSNPTTVEKVPPKSARLSVWKPGFSLNRPLPL